MLNLIFLSWNFFSPLFPLPFHKEWPDSSTQALAIPKQSVRCYVQKRTMCPSTLCSQMGRKTLESSAEPAHLGGEMSGAEQVSQLRKNNLLCLL